MDTNLAFWVPNNKWWTYAARQMNATGLKGERLPTEEWDEADRRLWCLSYRVVHSDALDSHDRADLVQDILLRLQDPELRKKLAVIDAPAHYLAEMMRNLVRNSDKRRRRARRTRPHYAKPVESDEGERPDHRAAKNELCAHTRFIVNHVLRADDRKILWWFYKDGLSVAEISSLLGIKEVAALQRLSRARKRLREAFRQ